MSFRALSALSLVLFFLLEASALDTRCGLQADNTPCPDQLCCSAAGYCGNTYDYCHVPGCQSQCHPLPDYIDQQKFDWMFPLQTEPQCASQGFYTFDAFKMAVMQQFPGFAADGNEEQRKREIAAFLAQTAYATRGAPDVAEFYTTWGYCNLTEYNPSSDYCDEHYQCPKQYYGRGPIQLTWNYNYKHAGEIIGEGLLNDPDQLVTDAVVSFKSALWLWMTSDDKKPSCHDAITEAWIPDQTDKDEGRYPGFGLTTNILNGAAECGDGPNVAGEKRIIYYKKFCDILGVDYGDHLDCYEQKPFASAGQPLIAVN